MPRSNAKLLVAHVAEKNGREMLPHKSASCVSSKPQAYELPFFRILHSRRCIQGCLGSPYVVTWICVGVVCSFTTVPSVFPWLVFQASFLALLPFGTHEQHSSSSKSAWRFHGQAPKPSPGLQSMEDDYPSGTGSRSTAPSPRSPVPSRRRRRKKS